MQTDRHGILSRARLQVIVKRLRDLIHSRLRRTIRIPSSESVVGDAPYASAHVGPYGAWGKALEFFDRGGFPR